MRPDPALHDPRRPQHPARRPLLALTALLLAVAGVVGGRSVTSTAAPTPVLLPPRDVPTGAPVVDDPLGVAGGRLPEGTTVDDHLPGTDQLDPGLRSALRAAGRSAAQDGVRLTLTSGWRSAAYQERLLEEAVTAHGSRAEAARWVATPQTSPHVRGEAVDLAGVAGIDWLARHGARHRLCQVYANEPWHFELRPDAVDQGCPRPYADPTDDPRMRR